MAWAICLTNGFITLSSDYLYVLGTSLQLPVTSTLLTLSLSAMLKTTPMCESELPVYSLPLALLTSF